MCITESGKCDLIREAKLLNTELHEVLVRPLETAKAYDPHRALSLSLLRGNLTPVLSGENSSSCFF